MPRRPGVFPIDFPPEHTLKTQPIPGQPLEGDSDSIEFLLRNAFRASERFKSMGPGIFPTLAPGATPEAKAIAPSKSTVVKSSRPAHVVESLAPLMGFAVVSRAPPKFRPKAIQYPSGNALGTQLHQPFGDRLKAMMTALMAPKKPV
jgi:hypothetical protein